MAGHEPIALAPEKRELQIRFEIFHERLTAGCVIFRSSAATVMLPVSITALKASTCRGFICMKHYSVTEVDLIAVRLRFIITVHAILQGDKAS